MFLHQGFTASRVPWERWRISTFSARRGNDVMRCVEHNMDLTRTLGLDKNLPLNNKSPV